MLENLILFIMGKYNNQEGDKSMGILQDLREQREYKKHRNKEKNMERRIIKDNISDSQFRRKYDSFLESLLKTLSEKFVQERRKMVDLKPNKVQDSALFEEAMRDERVNVIYEVTRRNDGSYSFEVKEIDLLDEVFDDEEYGYATDEELEFI